jgi:hypothetical protein
MGVRINSCPSARFAPLVSEPATVEENLDCVEIARRPSQALTRRFDTPIDAENDEFICGHARHADRKAAV